MNNSDEKEILAKGKIIQDHLDTIHLDPWIYIYENFVNPRNTPKNSKNDQA